MLRQRSHTIPGISDHDGVYAELDLQPICPKLKRRLISFYKRADWESLRNHMTGVHAEADGKRDKHYAKQKKSKSPSQTTKYKNLKHQIQEETRRAYWEYVENIIRPLDEEKPYEGMKRFWTMIKHARSDSCGVAPLRDHGLLISDAQGKAEILNKQFQSAFTRENPVPPDVKDRPSPYPTAPDISISTEGVQKMLQT